MDVEVHPVVAVVEPVGGDLVDPAAARQVPADGGDRGGATGQHRRDRAVVGGDHRPPRRRVVKGRELEALGRRVRQRRLGLLADRGRDDDVARGQPDAAWPLAHWPSSTRCGAACSPPR
ncbi:MAG TPA: hypothetical protein VHZ33_22375 [Trebonia sp.]|nr:hypothetical protein [Trebonia sp.]